MEVVPIFHPAPLSGVGDKVFIFPVGGRADVEGGVMPGEEMAGSFILGSGVSQFSLWIHLMKWISNTWEKLGLLAALKKGPNQYWNRSHQELSWSR